MSTKSKAVALALAVALSLACWFYHRAEVSARDAVIASLEKDAAEFQQALIGVAANNIAAHSKAASESLQQRDKQHEIIHDTGTQVQVNIATATSAEGEVDLDAYLPLSVSDGKHRLYCAASEASGNPGDGCSRTAGAVVSADTLASPACQTWPAHDSAAVGGLEREADGVVR